MNSSVLRLGIVIGAAICLAACTNRHHDDAGYHQREQGGFYAPGLGEIMAQSAVRHAKLWFAGQAGNWALAAYEVDELREGFEDAAKYHPSHKSITQPIPDLIAKHMDQPLAALEQAIKNKNAQTFADNYDRLTAACNTCHQATDFGFTIVTRPSFNPFANQAFGAIN